MTFANYQGTAEQYIREYLDPDGTLNNSPTTSDEASALWHQLEAVFVADGGTGISEEKFIDAVAEMQGQF
jgi:hypothetical protein